MRETGGDPCEGYRVNTLKGSPCEHFEKHGASRGGRGGLICVAPGLPTNAADLSDTNTRSDVRATALPLAFCTTLYPF
jgi:hypothetical protein